MHNHCVSIMKIAICLFHCFISIIIIFHYHSIIIFRGLRFVSFFKIKSIMKKKMIKPTTTLNTCICINTFFFFFYFKMHFYYTFSIFTLCTFKTRVFIQRDMSQDFRTSSPDLHLVTLIITFAKFKGWHKDAVFTSEVATADVIACVQVNLIHFGCNLRTNVFMFPITDKSLIQP